MRQLQFSRRLSSTEETALPIPEPTVTLLLMKHLFRLALGLLAAAPWLIGCQSHRPEYLMTVSNQGDQPIRDVQVAYAGDLRGSGSIVEPGVERGQWHPGTALGGPFMVRWKDSNNQPHEVQLEPDIALHAPFEGEFYIQFKDGGQARLFVMHERKRAVSVLPWSQPAQWEQAPSIPGLSDQ